MLARSIRAFSSSSSSKPNVAVILSGCGVYDGTEVTEGVSTLIHLSSANALFTCYAPDKDQMHAVDHTCGEEHAATRNVLVESARIARGVVSPLASLDASKYSALVIPGGFGAAKNLSSFAVDGPDMTVDPDLAKVIKGFRSENKPIGMCCIAPTIAAKMIPNAKLTVGQSSGPEEMWPHSGAAGSCEAMGATHVDTEIDGVCIDSDNKLVTSAAYMKNAR
ncbi:hypothetical protein TL16_g08861 [Triparma laevis f. inornata]|uniref:DJ-1/PfpI domain-containing protein n=1 Tax=Triparma laevis f. inornata TaxID=1714386 RepID=A0A9W7B6E3_9STRA|nr:hypothetical protein TL16_g08861 [Triparma laevis f. inornata]